MSAVMKNLDDQMGAHLVPGADGDVLLMSMRRVAHFVAYCLAYEFEDTTIALTGADCVDVGDEAALELSRRVYKLARYTTGSSRLASGLAPSPSTVHLARDYELFFPIFNHTHELYSLATIPNWRQRSRKAACFIVEVWPHLLPNYLLEKLLQFDHIFIGFRNCVDEIAKITGKPCSYLPLGTDVLRFSPSSMDAARPIDVYNIGRRSNITHSALLKIADERKIFYYYDTVAASGAGGKHRTFQVDNPSEHRRMLASLLQRSRYYIANRSYVNIPEVAKGLEEISARFYEGAASGAVMIGEAPKSKEFDQQFNWPDAVINLPFNSPQILEFLTELDQDKQRLERIRRNNVTNAALRHDWVYRLKTVFDTLNVTPTAAMNKRMESLNILAQQASN